jgi:hypothetical protein
MDAAASEAAGENLDDILAEAGDLVLNLSLGSIANADHGDDGRNANNHTEHREQGAQFVPAQGAHRNLHGGEKSSHVAS